MLPVSVQWQKEIRQPIRNAAFLRVRFDVIAPGARENCTITSNSNWKYSNPQNILLGNAFQELPDAWPKYATFEKDRFADDGSFIVLPDSGIVDNTSWTSDAVYDASKGHFVTSDGSAINPTVTFTFSRNFKCSNLIFLWDVATNSWPTDFEVIAYRKNDSVITDLRFTDCETVEYYAPGFYDEFWKIEVIIYKWSQDGWRARMNNIIFGFYKVFDDSEFMDVQQTHKESALVTAIPTNEFKMTLKNLDRWFNPENLSGVSSYIQDYQHIYTQWGFELSDGTIEWVDSNNYFLSGWKANRDVMKVEFTGKDLLAFMTMTYDDGLYTGAPQDLYSIVQDIFRFSDVDQYSDDPVCYIPEIYKQIYIDLPVPKLPCNQLCQLIAQATGCMIRPHPVTGGIRFEPNMYQLVYNNITDRCQTDWPEITLNSILKNVIVIVTRPQVDNEYTNLFDEVFEESAEITVQFDSPYVSYQVYAQVPEDNDAQTWSARASRTQVATDVWGRALNSDARVLATGWSVEILSYSSYKATLKITKGANAVPQAQIILEGLEVVLTQIEYEAYNNENITMGETLKIENPIICNYDLADTVGKKASEIFTQRQTLKISYNGDPAIQPMDIYKVQSYFGFIPTLITSATLKYNGAWSGELEGNQVIPNADFPGYDLYTGTFEAGNNRTVQVLDRNRKMGV